MTAQLIPNLPMAEYAALPAIGSHGLGTILDKSPAHFRFAEREETPALARGTAVHELTLEPETFATNYYVSPHERPNMTYKVSKELHAAELAIAGGKRFLWADEYADCRGMRDSIWGYECETDGGTFRLADLLRGSKREVSAVWTCPDTGVACKARFDVLRATAGGYIIADVKTTRDARAWKFWRDGQRLGYHRQAAFYSWALECLGMEFKAFLFLAVEPKKPYAVSIVQPSARCLEISLPLIQRGLTIYKKCLETDTWPGLPAGIHMAELDPWHEQNQQEEGEES